MPRIVFTLGYQEKHGIVVNVSMRKGSTIVWIDGKKVPDEQFRPSVYAPDFTLPNMTLSIGEKEHHEMEIRFGRWMWSGLSILVDGRDVYQWKPFRRKGEPFGYGISEYPTPSTAT